MGGAGRSDDIDERKLPAVTCDVCKRIFDVRLVKRIIFSLYAEHKVEAGACCTTGQHVALAQCNMLQCKML